MKPILATLLIVFAVALVVARLAGVIHAGWVWVLAPIWFPAALSFLRSIVFPRRRH